MKPLFGAILALSFYSACVAAAAQPKTRLAHVGLQLDGAWGFMKQEQAEPEAELVAVADSHPDLIEKAKAVTGPGTKFYADYVKMLDEVKPDAVIATTPNAEHLELLKACAKRHIHLWFQKPMATNVKDAKEMERLANEAGITLMINYWTLWEPALQAITARVQAGDIGPVQRFWERNSFPASKDADHKRQSTYYFNYFHNAALHGGGAIMDQGTYGIDYAVWLLGRPSSVFARGKKLRDLKDLSAEDDGWVVLDYPKATAVLWAGWWILPDTGGIGDITLVGPKGILQQNSRTGTVTLTLGADPEKGIEASSGPQAVAAPPIPRERQNGVAHFVDCIRNKKAVDAPHTPALNVTVQEVVEAAYESIRTGRAVSLPAQ
jgi:predicted dehydrogenase